MSHSASGVVEEYLSRLRSELSAAGAEDTDELVAEIRSLLDEATAEDPAAAAFEIERLGDPAELARAILAERGLDAAAGMSPGVWWRLGIAAPVDLAIGLAVPAAAAVPLYVAAVFGQPRGLSLAIAVALGVATLVWPFFVWRPWRTGGRTLSPGMTLTGLAVVRAPGAWRLVRLAELEALGLAPRRRTALAVVVALFSAVLLVGASVIPLDVGGAWLADAAISAEFSGATVGGGVPIATQLQGVIEQVYIGLMGATGSEMSTARPYVAPEASSELEDLWTRVEGEGIRSVRIGEPRQIATGVYRFEVDEFADPGANRVGTATFIVGRRMWLRADGIGSDWVVIGIELGTDAE